MAVYAVFEPPLKQESSGAAGAMERALRVTFVRDGFSWTAFLLGPLWMLYHRLWLAVACYVAIIFAITLAAYSFGLTEAAVTLASLLIALLLGFEAATLRRRKLLRRRWRDCGVVVEKSREAAERRFFDRWVAAGAVQAVPAAENPDRPAAFDPESHVVGLFPPKETPTGNQP
jgi:hypothetical protein